MSSKFFDELQDARRRPADAPPALADGVVPPEGSTVKGTLTPLAPGVFRCDDCSIPVDADGAAPHAAWHRRLGV